MKLLVIELLSELTQVINPDRNEHVEAIRLHLYKHNHATGHIYIQIRDENNHLISESNKILITDIESEDFFHGQIRFDINAHLQQDTSYNLVLCHDGYSFDESAYIGWCIDFDFHSYPKDYFVDSPLKSSFDYEIWSRK